LEEAERLVAGGAVELNLIAEDTNQWGQDRRDGRNLATLLRELSVIPGLRFIRLLYCYPSYFTDELIEEIASNEKVAGHNIWGHVAVHARLDAYSLRLVPPLSCGLLLTRCPFLNFPQSQLLIGILNILQRNPVS
jgi:hypothetical protein